MSPPSVPAPVRRSTATGAPTPAVRALQEAGVRFELRRYRHDPAVTGWGREAAAQLGAEEARVLKTLVLEADGAPAVALLPVSGELDARLAAAALAARRVALPERSKAERLTGYVVGGVSPFGQRRRLPTVLDATVAGWETVLVSGGQRGLEIELRPHDLMAVTGGRLCPLQRSERPRPASSEPGVSGGGWVSGGRR